MTGVLGSHIARRHNIPLYLDVWDIFTDAIGDLFAGKPQAVVLPIFRWLERKMVRRASVVNLVSPGFTPHFRRLRPDLEFRTFTNGIDDEFLTYPFSETVSDRTEPVVLYAGNIGDGQGLHRILPEAARLAAGRYRFRVFGTGGRVVEL